MKATMDAALKPEDSFCSVQAEAPVGTEVALESRCNWGHLQIVLHC